MPEKNSYLINQSDDSISDILKRMNQDVKKSEDILTLGLCVVMLSTMIAPIAPPFILLPLVALIFAASSTYARLNYHKIEKQLLASIGQLAPHQKKLLAPIVVFFTQYPTVPLAESFNPLLNLKRTWKSALGGILINPFWMPIFYMMGIQISEETNIRLLIDAIIAVETKLSSKNHPFN